MTKKQWDKPKLVVLARGKPEEAVLIICKHSWRDGANNFLNSCMAYGDTKTSGPGTCWTECNSFLSS